MTSGVIHNDRIPWQETLFGRLSNLGISSEEIRTLGIESVDTIDGSRERSRLRSAALRQSCICCRIGFRRKKHVHRQECTRAHRRTAKTGVAGVTA